jgi:hypothetical protein
LVFTAKLKVYVHSLELSTLEFVDKEGAMHACAQAGKTAFQGLERVSNLLGDRYLCDEERRALTFIEEYCRNNGLEYEVIDLAAMSFLQKLQLRMKGIKAPAVCYEEEIVRGIPAEDDLRKLTTA